MNFAQCESFNIHRSLRGSSYLHMHIRARLMRSEICAGPCRVTPRSEGDDASLTRRSDGLQFIALQKASCDIKALFLKGPRRFIMRLIARINKKINCRTPLPPCLFKTQHVCGGECSDDRRIKKPPRSRGSFSGRPHPVQPVLSDVPAPAQRDTSRVTDPYHPQTPG